MFRSKFFLIPLVLLFLLNLLLPVSSAAPSSPAGSLSLWVDTPKTATIAVGDGASGSVKVEYEVVVTSHSKYPVEASLDCQGPKNWTVLYLKVRGFVSF